MKKINIILQISLFFSIYSSFAMNRQEYEHDYQHETRYLKIRDSGGKLFLASPERMEKLSFFANALGDCDDSTTSVLVVKNPFFYCLHGSDAFKERSLTLIEDGKKIIQDDFCPTDPFIAMPEDVDPTITEKDIIETLIECANNDSIIESIHFEKMKTIIKAADYFRVSDTILQQIALRFEECVSNDSEIHDYMLQHGGTSIASLGEYTVDSREELQNDKELYSLDLSNLQNKGLQTLYGLHLIKDKTLIKTLNIANNEIIRLDVRAILEILPEIREIDASNNKKLKILVLPKNLPDHFKLYLDSNPVEYISPFKAGQEGILSFSKGCLSEQAMNTLNKAILPNVYEKRMHYPFFAKRISLAAGLGFALGGFCGLGTFGPKIQSNNTNVPFFVETSIRATCYSIEKFMQLRGYKIDSEMEKDLIATEFLAKLLAVGGMLTMPLILKFLPNLNFTIPILEKNVSLNIYSGYPVYKPSQLKLDS